MAINKNNQLIKGFDGVRAIAVILVLLTHLQILKQLPDPYNSIAYYHLFSGLSGVHLFFLLSGFLITNIIIRDWQFGRFSIRDFYARRILRIFPLYYLILALTVLVNLFIWPIAETKSILYAGGFITNFIEKADKSHVLMHTWTLSVEQHFYILWPFIIIYILRCSWRNLGLFLLVFVLFCMILQILMISMTDLVQTYFVDRWSFTVSYSIALGCMASIGVNFLPRKYAVLISRHKYLIIVLASILCLHNFMGITELPFRISYFIRDLGFMIFLIYIFNHQDSIFVKILHMRPIQYIGQISYGIYMWQGFFLSTNPYRTLEQLWPPSALLGLIAVVIISPISYHFFEKPFLSLKNKFGNR